MVMGGGVARLVRGLVASDAGMAAMLADYGGEPAFFYSKAPSDSGKGWGRRRYPRADFTVDTRGDPERKAAGTMTANIFVTTETPQVGGLDPDRAVAERLIGLLSGTLLTDASEGTYCMEWDRADAFVLETQSAETHPEVYGLSVSFDVLAFPPQETSEPDPVQGLNRWTKRNFGEVAAIGHDALPEVFRPTGARPAIYWRVGGDVATDGQSYAVTWHDGTFHAHVICGGVQERNRWIKAIAQRARSDGEVILPDGSPMFLRQVTVRPGADPLREGQIEVAGRYGVLETPPKEPLAPRLRHAALGRQGKD